MIYDIAVIGGGAAGLFAACWLKNRNIVILEKHSRIGKKILATGNGRCNFTNLYADTCHYFTKDKNTLEKILSQYAPEDILYRFKELGMLSRTEDDGRAYPYSNQAGTVLDCLMNKISSLGVEIKTDFNVQTIKKDKNIFKIHSGTEEVLANAIIFSTGSKAGENEGEKGSYFLLEKLGHAVIKPVPSLVPLKIKGDFCKSMKGIRAKCTIKAISRKQILMAEQGEILFTEYGLSGIAVMQLSSLYSQNEEMFLEIDFLPDFSYPEIMEMLIERQREKKMRSAEEFLTGMINKKLGLGIMKVSGIEKLSVGISEINGQHIKAIAQNLKSFTLEATGTTGFKNAQTSRGGLKLSQFNPYTMESNLVKGLYGAGEVLDVNGLCGGYNLHFAWVTGLIAANALAHLQN